MNKLIIFLTLLFFTLLLSSCGVPDCSNNLLTVQKFDVINCDFNNLEITLDQPTNCPYKIYQTCKINTTTLEISREKGINYTVTYHDNYLNLDIVLPKLWRIEYEREIGTI